MQNNHWHQDVDRLKHVQSKVTEFLVDRQVEAKLLGLAAICQEHLLLIGPSGTAKSLLVSQFAKFVNPAKCFHRLLTRFTEPAELFGGLDIERFQAGEYHINTADMLPECELAVLDEIFLGSGAILNTLLSLINEREFHNGRKVVRVPLVSLIGTSNAFPDDPSLAAFADRFVLRRQVREVGVEHLPMLIEHGEKLNKQRAAEQAATEAGEEVSHLDQAGAKISVQTLRKLNRQLASVEMAKAREPYAEFLKSLRSQGIVLSDRRIVKGLKLIAGAAVLDKTLDATLAHFWPLAHIWSQPQEGEMLARILDELKVPDTDRIEQEGPQTLSNKLNTAHSAAKLDMLRASPVRCTFHLADLKTLKTQALAYRIDPQLDATQHQKQDLERQQLLVRIEAAIEETMGIFSEVSHV